MQQYQQAEGISVFHFSKDEELRKKWIEQVKKISGVDQQHTQLYAVIIKVRTPFRMNANFHYLLE